MFEVIAKNTLHLNSFPHMTLVLNRLATDPAPDSDHSSLDFPVTNSFWRSRLICPATHAAFWKASNPVRVWLGSHLEPADPESGTGFGLIMSRQVARIARIVDFPKGPPAEILACSRWGCESPSPVRYETARNPCPLFHTSKRKNRGGARVHHYNVVSSPIFLFRPYADRGLKCPCRQTPLSRPWSSQT